jgi:hypothetical protein
MSGMLESFCALLWATSPAGEAFLGRVEGGWGYVWFSYGLVWVSLLGYAVYLLRLRRHLQALPPEGEAGPSSPPPSPPAS